MSEYLKINKVIERVWMLKCPKCNRKCGIPRSGADFAGQYRCNNCHHYWNPEYSNFYAALP